MSSQQNEKEYSEDVFEGRGWVLSFVFISWVFLFNWDQFLNKKGHFVAFKSLKTEDSKKNQKLCSESAEMKHFDFSEIKGHLKMWKWHITNVLALSFFQ